MTVEAASTGTIPDLLQGLAGELRLRIGAVRGRRSSDYQCGVLAGMSVASVLVGRERARMSEIDEERVPGRVCGSGEAG